MKKIFIFFSLPLIFAACDFIANNSDNSGLASGCAVDQAKYDKIEVYEALADGSKNQLPAAVSLLRYAPSRKSQGKQGSCVAWATAYAACSINEARAKGISGDQAAFSPSFLYNQVKQPNCYGSYTNEALTAVTQKGLVPFSKFPYNENDCSKMPDRSLFELAQNYKLKGFNRLTINDYEYVPSINAIKQHLAQGAPIVISMMSPRSFKYDMWKSDLWKPAPNEKNYTFKYFISNNLTDFGVHAMCIIGYDDKKYGGSFHIMNSWGDNWGKDGNFWVSYENFEKYGIEAYGIYPSEQLLKVDKENDFSVSFGLIDASTNKNILVQALKGNSFQTLSPIKKGSKFKIEVSNSEPCYIYIFGQETDGSTYVLFPYVADNEKKSKYSPFCGIVGTRHFPSGKASLKADDIGNRDYIAVVVSKKELDYQVINTRLNNSNGILINRLNMVLSSEQFENPKFEKGTSTISFKAKSNEDQFLLGIVLGIDKN